MDADFREWRAPNAGAREWSRPFDVSDGSVEKRRYRAVSALTGVFS